MSYTHKLKQNLGNLPVGTPCEKIGESYFFPLGTFPDGLQIPQAILLPKNEWIEEIKSEKSNTNE